MHISMGWCRHLSKCFGHDISRDPYPSRTVNIIHSFIHRGADCGRECTSTPAQTVTGLSHTFCPCLCCCHCCWGPLLLCCPPYPPLTTLRGTPGRRGRRTCRPRP
jgi:hypothetical protein